jgi:hypothetical protein
MIEDKNVDFSFIKDAKSVETLVKLYGYDFERNRVISTNAPQ